MHRTSRMLTEARRICFSIPHVFKAPVGPMMYAAPRNARFLLEALLPRLLRFACCVLPDVCTGIGRHEEMLCSGGKATRQP